MLLGFTEVSQGAALQRTNSNTACEKQTVISINLETDENDMQPRERYTTKMATAVASKGLEDT